ncbi:MAG: hypothetical protein ACTSWY_07165 [Promethearchaeota archaeon]
MEGNKKLHDLYKRMANVAWRSRFSLMKHDWKTLGTFFEQNNRIIEKIMKYCGFKHGIGWANKTLIDLIKNDPDVYSIKLTGAGQGGSVFALVKNEEMERLITLWRERLNSLLKTPEKIRKQFMELSLKEIDQLKHTRFYRVQIDFNGVTRI